MTPGFSVAVSFEEGTTVVEAKGELDMASVHDLHEAFTDLDPGTRAVVVDLTGLTFMDSTGIGALVQARQRLAADGLDWELLVTEGPVTKVLRLTDLMERLGAQIVE